LKSSPEKHKNKVSAGDKDSLKDLNKILQKLPEEERLHIALLFNNISKTEHISVNVANELIELDKYHSGFIEWTQNRSDLQQDTDNSLRSKALEVGIENELQKRAIERVSVEGQVKYSLRGQLLGFALCICVLALGTFLAFYGYEALSAILYGGSFAAIIIAFVSGRLHKRSE